ncbi:MAG: ribosome silencing factor [Roseofilum sp. SBFL]|uniref:ribosome silencing factor n=1 Tax=unclassified Roseofilum TaxID=2620099 RepID=UPI001B16C2A3|nr:ribosome silencing factor [Roseofilum sp. SID3]MBP0024949.1 ribosome silencing factor [Roseofilum sp. SID2]MBP0039067.1 ribosome silencing factor [Roseofilum sp. SID1]MBP0043451.1 ribosome silencing factor [Roseofilum sp. SBFL]
MSNFGQTPLSPTSIPSSAPSSPLSIESSQHMARTIAEAADDRKGGDILILKVDEVSYLADFFILVTGFSTVQVRAIARAIEDSVEENFQRFPLRTEGKAEGSWILQDFGEVIVHIFLPEERQFYNLDAFWSHAEVIEFKPKDS